MLLFPRRYWLGYFKLWLSTVMLLVVSTRSFGHPADVQYLQIHLLRDRAELRFTFNLWILAKFCPNLDADHDGQLRPPELDHAKIELLEYLRHHVHLAINGKATPLPAWVDFQTLWPNPESAVRETDFAARHFDVSFECTTHPVLDSLGLKFTLWKEAGPQATIEATFDQEDWRTHIPFSMNEPDYVHYTGFRLDDLFLAPQTRAKASGVPFHAWKPWAMIFLGSGVVLLILRRVAHRPS